MAATWQLVDGIARLTHDGLAAQLHVAKPDAGAAHIAWRGGGLENTRLFSVGWAAGDAALGPVSEAFVRGRDLVAVYAEQPGKALRVQLDWRALSIECELAAKTGTTSAQNSLHGVELIISVQTSLLDSQPALHVSSAYGWERGSEVVELVAAESGLVANPCDFVQEPLRVSAPEKSRGAYLVRWPGRDFTLAQLVYPSDFETAEIRWAGCSGPAECRYTLFARHLEKGVIRRARVRTLFLPREHDVGWAAAALAEFSRSALPLTA